MVAKKKPLKPKKCVVCLMRNRVEWSLCKPCDNDYALNLASGMGSLEWAANRAREQAAILARRKRSGREPKK